MLPGRLALFLFAVHTNGLWDQLTPSGASDDTGAVWADVWAPSTKLRGANAKADDLWAKADDLWAASDVPEVVPTDAIKAPTPTATKSQWSDFFGVKDSSKTCSVDAYESMDTVLETFQTCLAPDLGMQQTTTPAVAGAGVSERFQSAVCQHKAGWKDHPYKCCAEYRESKLRYPGFKWGVVLYQSWSLNQAPSSLPNLPSRQMESVLLTATKELPPDAFSALNNYCYTKCIDELDDGTVCAAKFELKGPHRRLNALNYKEVSAQAACFRDDSTALVRVTDSDIINTNNSSVTRVVKKRMAALAAGDEVLVVDEATGVQYFDRVSINLHTRDNTQDHEGVTLHYDGGNQLSVTHTHLLVANGKAVPAHNVKVGDTMTVVKLMTGGSTSNASTVTITHVEPWTGGIINPITHTGRILAGAGASDGISGSTFVLATTTLESPLNVQLTLVSLPSVMKLGSLMFPRQLQDSHIVEAAILTITSATAAIQHAITAAISPVTMPLTNTAVQGVAWAFSVLLFLIVDLAVGTSFVIAQLLSTAVGIASATSLSVAYVSVLHGAKDALEPQHGDHMHAARRQRC